DQADDERVADVVEHQTEAGQPAQPDEQHEHDHPDEQHQGQAADHARAARLAQEAQDEVDPHREHADLEDHLEGLVEIGAERHQRAPPAAIASATRTTSRIDRTSCTRTHSMPASASAATAAAVANSRSSTGRPVSAPRNDLRDGPTTSGRPSRRSSPIRAMMRGTSSARVPKPSPGSSRMRERSMPRATAYSTRAASASA